MSEKELRDLITEYHESHEPSEYEHCFCPTCQKRTVLADDPDVVKVLRQVRAAANSTVRGSDERLLNLLADEIAERQHVRLTADGGYEWTDA